MANNEFIGRRVSVGLGVESTYGTEVAPTQWMKQTKLDFQRKTTTVQNTSAMGRNEDVNDSALVSEWAEGNLEGKVYDISIGYLLYNTFGSLANATNADASGTVFDHTFTVSTSQIAKSLTLTRVDALSNRRHGMATIDSLDISVKQADWAMVTAGFKAKTGVTGSDTAAYTAENAFTSKHVTVKSATNLAGLSGATALSPKSLKLTIKRDATTYIPLGSIDPVAINTGKWSATGEIVLRYTDTTLEALWAANTQQALQIAFKNTDVTIGTSTNPSLTFTAPKARFSSFSMSNDLDNVIEQTVGFTCELDSTAGYMLQAVLTNTKNAY
jgi:hypothetical protein